MSLYLTEIEFISESKRQDNSDFENAIAISEAYLLPEASDPTEARNEQRNEHTSFTIDFRAMQDELRDHLQSSKTLDQS